MWTEAALLFAGALFGALLTGAVQVARDVLDRRRARRTAARVLFAELVTIRSEIDMAREKDSWWSASLPLEGWESYRDALADDLSATDFHDVSEAFWLAQTAERDATTFPAKMLPEDLSTRIKKAEGIVYEQGLSRQERKAEGRR